MINLEWMFERLTSFSECDAVIWRDHQYSYQELLKGVAEWREILAEYEIKPGESVALFGDFSPDITMLLLALIANKNIAVPLTASVLSEMENYLKTACVSAVFEFDESDSWYFERRHDVGDPLPPILQTLRESGEAGLILFSSGSTGKPKAALHSFAKMLEKFSQKRLRSYRTLPFLLFSHVGGINILFSSLCNGGTIISPKDRTADAICQAIERHQVELLPTTPTFMNMLLISGAYKNYDLSSLKLITYGSEPMPLATLDSFAEALPHVQLKQAYGLTELGVLSTRSDAKDSRRLKMGSKGHEMKVVDGIIWVRAQSPMLGYLNAPSPFDAEGWFNTGDAVSVKDGYMRVLGRKSEIINVGGEKVFPAEVESVILQMDNIKDVTVIGKSNPIIGHVVVATVELFEPEESAALERRVRQFCREQLAPFKVPAIVKNASNKLYNARFKKVRRH